MSSWFDDIIDEFSEYFDDMKEFCCYSKTKQQLKEQLEAKEIEFNNICSKLTNSYANLNKLREDSSREIIPIVENYINTLANSPKKFNDSFARLGWELNIYQQTNNSNGNFAIANKNTNNKDNTNTIIGVSTLASVVLDNIAFLGVGTALSVLNSRSNNKEFINKSVDYINEYSEQIYIIEIKIEKTNQMINETTNFRREILQLVTHLQNNAPKNYPEFNQSQKHELTALINNIKAFSKILNKKV